MDPITFSIVRHRLFRGRVTDSGGPGKHRGGTGMEIALTPHDAPDGGLHYVITGEGTAFPMSDGLSGGYPGAPNCYRWVHNDAAPEDGRNPDAAFAQSVAEMPGEPEDVSWGVHPVTGEDVLYLRWNGAGGYGDPLARDPQAVLSDCAEGVVSVAAARDIYGVVFEAGRSAVDIAATSAPAPRAEGRAHRPGGRRMSARVSEALERRGAMICCRGCGRELAPPGVPWKPAAALDEAPMRGAGGAVYSAAPEVLLRRFRCPGCGALLDCETALEGDPFLDDVIYG